MVKMILGFFDRLEDRIRIRLSHWPILYAFIGAVGIILVWKGVWETAELFPSLYGPPSAVLGAGILLLTGLLVSFFIGDSIIISGFKGEKKLVEKTEKEVSEEQVEMTEVITRLDHIEEELDSLGRDKK